MNRKINRITGALLLSSAGASIFMLFRLHQDTTGIVSADRAQHNYVFLSPEKEESFFLKIAEGVKGADREEGSDTLLVEYSDNNEIAPYFQDAVLSKSEGIIVKGTAIIDNDIQDAVESGIPVIFYNNDVRGSARSCYVGVNNYEAGREAIENVLNQDDSVSRILVIVRGVNVSSIAERVKAINDVAGEHENIEVSFLETMGDEVVFRNGFSDILSSGELPDAMICMDDVSSELLGDYMEEYGILPGQIYTVTTDDTQSTARYLEDGIYSAAVLQNIYQIGYQSVTILNDYYEHKDADESASIPNTQYLENVVVTSENMQEYFKQYETEKLYWNTY